MIIIVLFFLALILLYFAPFVLIGAGILYLLSVPFQILFAVLGIGGSSGRRYSESYREIPGNKEEDEPEDSESYHRVRFEDESDDRSKSEECKKNSQKKEEDPFTYPTNNDYFTSDYNHNYNSYYSQLSAEAMAGDWEAISEMREEFGDDWEGIYS